MNARAGLSLWSRLRGLFGGAEPANSEPTDVEEVDEELEEPEHDGGHGLPPLLAGPDDAPILARLAESDDPLLLSPPGIAVEVLDLVKSDDVDLARLE